MTMSITRRGLCTGAALGMAAVASTSGVAAQAAEPIEPELFSATVQSARGDLTASVAFDGDRIAAISIVDPYDTPLIAGAAIADVPQRIIEGQNIEVDVTTGATFTSMAIVSAVEKCIEAAGLDADAYRKGSDAQEKTTAPDDETDILVIGSGFAGFAAAIEALRAGAPRVTVVESQAYVGGSSLLSGGGFCSFSSKYNEQIGNVLSEDDVIAYFSRGEGAEGEELQLIKNIYAVNADAFEYIVEHGFEIDPDIWTYSREKYGTTPVFWEPGRMDNTWDPGAMESGRIEALDAMAVELGADIRVNTRAVELIQENGAVVGARVEGPDSVYDIRAKKTILATGSFGAASQEFLEKWSPASVGMLNIGGPGCTGDGIVMAEGCGVPIVGEGGSSSWAVVSMTDAMYGPVGDLAFRPPLVVGADCEVIASRVFAEYKDMEGIDNSRRELWRSGGASGDDIMAQPDKRAYAVFDSGTSMGLNFQDRCMQAVREGKAERFASIEEGAQAYGLDSEKLAGLVRDGGLTVAPYFIVPVYAGNSGADMFPQIDSSCRAVDADGTPVENLYAAGVLAFPSIVVAPGSGMYACTSYYTGAIAGRAAAAEL